MQKLFDEVGFLDARASEKFFLSEEILMEHAAKGMALYISSNHPKSSTLLIVCGSGNNGADGLALARLLYKEFSLCIFCIKAPKSALAKLQYKRAKSLGITQVNDFFHADIIVDSFVGTGFKGSFTPQDSKIMKTINDSKSFKLACDVPSGLQKNGNLAQESFIADLTLTMGALKKSLLSDMAKDFVGKFQVLDLGLSRDLYETNTNWHLLDLDDLQLPHRIKKDSHKGTYGHLAVVCGEKSGAALLSALSATKFGVGLVTLISQKELTISNIIMQSQILPKNSSCIALGMGLGKDFSKQTLQIILDSKCPLLLDADIFYMPLITEFLLCKNLVITPHPKEFVSLLLITNIANITIQELQKNRFMYVEIFCKKFPHLTLLLKGANVIIGHNEKFFINPHGTAILAKGGSGDVLSGLIAALLAQGYKSLDAAISASLAHTKIALNYTGADFSLTADDLIAGIGNL